MTAPRGGLRPPGADAAVIPPKPLRRNFRRRRSAAESMPMFTPTDIPEDAEGRVAIFAVRMPRDAAALIEPAADGGRSRRWPALLASYLTIHSWTAVATLGVILILVFAIGMKVAK